MSAGVQCVAASGVCVCVCVCVCVRVRVCVHVFTFIRCAGLKSATSDLQKDKEKFERDLIPLSQSVNEARSKVSSPNYVH